MDTQPSTAPPPSEPAPPPPASAPSLPPPPSTTLPNPAPPPPADAQPAPALLSEPSQAPAADPAPPAAEQPEVDKFAVPYSDAARAAQSASQWNGLLRWARGARLAQGGVGGGWEWGTGMYHVPRDSPEYYSNVTRDPSSIPSSSHPRIIHTHNPNADLDEDSDGMEGVTGGRYSAENLSGRPRRSRAAMVRADR
ncbi:hypothetical protein JCM10207_000174 [Rhodosporidiobolus poonsookiae]